MTKTSDGSEDSDPDIDIQTPHFRVRAKARWMLAFGAGMALCFGSLAMSIVWMQAKPRETPQEVRNGWSADAFELEETQQIVSSMVPFQLIDENGTPISQDNRNANVRLWDAVIAVRGTHFVNQPQQIGDCVSWGMKHAIEYLICVEMKTGPPGQNEFHEVFSPYLYGISRHQVGKDRINGDGSCMAWAVKGVAEYGVLRTNEQGVSAYNGTIARNWGRSGPPQKFIEIARQTLVKMSSPVRSANEVRDAICNGYPVPFGAGGIGFDRTVEKHGRLVGQRSGSWSHAQCIIGYDGSGSEPLFCVLNSWGPLAGGKSPIDNSPPGSYWIVERDMEFIARQGDTFAISNFEGFKAREIDFRLTRKNKEKNHALLSMAL